MDSILLTIKKMIGPSADYDVFDTDLLVHINSTIGTLDQVGFHLSTPFVVTSEEETWDDYFAAVKHPDDGHDDFDDMTMRTVIDYIYLKVRMLFDPPTSSFVLEAMKEQSKELEWRISVMHDKTNY